jgi:hypothetical protein
VIYAAHEPVLAVESKIDHVGLPVTPPYGVGEGENIVGLLFGSDSAQHDGR